MFSLRTENSNMYREIREQEQIVKRVVEKNSQAVQILCQAVRERKIDKVLLVGRGSSEHALLLGSYAFEIYTTMTAEVAKPSVITRYEGKVDLSRTLTIGMSQCGEAKDVYTVLERCRKDGGIAVAVTNERTCLMRDGGNYYLNLECGKETGVTATKSYLAEVVTILMIVAELSENTELFAKLKSLPRLLGECLDKDIEAQIAQSLPLFRNVQDVIILGRGYSYAVAEEAELKIIEASYTNAKAYSSCDYCHGPVALTRRFTPFICFLTDTATDAVTVSLIERLKREFHISLLIVTNKAEYCHLGNAAVLLPSEAEGINGAFALAVFSQLFACLLAMARRYNPDEPVGLSKVTVTF